MAEEIDVGKIVAEIVLETKQAREDADEIQEQLKTLGDRVTKPKIKPELDDMSISYLQGSLESLGISAEKSADIIKNDFKGLIDKDTFNVAIVQRYSTALDDLSEKIENCETQKRAFSAVNDTEGIERTSNAIEQLNQMYTKTQTQLDSYVSSMLKVVQAENEINDLSGVSLPDVVTEKVTLNAQSYADTIDYIRDVLNNLGISGEKAEQIISSCFQDVDNLKKYQNNLEVLSSKIEMAQKQYQELAKARLLAEKQGNTSEIDKMTAAMDKQANTIKSLEARFDNTYTQMDTVVKKNVKNYEKQTEAVQKSAKKQDELNKKLANNQAGKNFAGAINLATTSLRTFNSVVPDAVSGIGEIITQVNAAKMAMTMGASAALSWGTAIVAGIGIAANLIINVVQKAVDAENEARQKSIEAQKSTAKNYIQDIQEAEAALDEKRASTDGEIGLIRSLAGEYEELRSKTNLTVDEQKELDNIAGQIAQTMNTTTQALKDQSGAYKSLSVDVEKYVKQLKIKSEIESTENVLKEAYKVESEVSQEDVKAAWKAYYDDYGEDLWQQIRDTSKYHDMAREGKVLDKYSALRNKELVDTVAGDWNKLKSLENTYSDLFIQHDQAVGTIEKYEEKLKNLYKELDNSDDKTEEYSNTVSELYSNMSDLSSAYKTVSEGGELDASTLQSLCKQYPDLANYISETGDLTLKNGRKIKEAYEEEQQALIDKLTAKKKELELEMESSKDKVKVKKDLAQINAELEIYKNLQIESSKQELSWSNISSEVKSLASAYQTLNEGKQLDVDTMIQLIDKYPTVATAMANEGKLGKEQANVLKQLFEAKKSDYILTQKRTIANLQASADETKGVINNIQSQINAYKMLDQVMGMSAIANLATNTLSATLAENQQEYNKIQRNIKQAQARINAVKNLNVNTYGNSSGRSGSDTNQALANELKRLEHKKALGQLTSKQEYNWLVRINNKYRKNSDEQMDMEKRLYNAKKQMQADEEAANTKALQAAYKGIENKKSLGKMSSQQELRQLEQIRQKYKMTAEERMELEIKIYNLKKSLKDDEISSINTLADAVTEALKQKYEEQRKLEEDRINESIESWQNWEDKTVSAIQGEIDALDELADKQESENKRQEYENKRQQTELQLAYEKDDYNRTQLQKELNRLDKEEAERLAEQQRQAQKKVLEGRIEAVKGQSQATQERLNKELNKLGEKYEKLTDSFSLKAQAQKLIADSTQKQIVSLIKSYASDYEIAGNTIGDALYNGMKAKMDNISAYVDSIFGKIEAYQRKMANTANASADRFWASQNSPQASQKQTASKSVTVQQTVNFNQPVESPVETRRQLDRTNQALAKQISSGI
nr:MAG TPA: hypothetical protein [Caudoviricetes sp.]